MRQLNVAVCACTPYVGQFQGIIIPTDDGDYEVNEVVIGERNHTAALKRVRAHAFVDVNKLEHPLYHNAAVSLCDTAVCFDGRGRRIENLLFGGILGDTAWTHYVGWVRSKGFPPLKDMVKPLRKLVNEVPRELRAAWYDRVRIHEVRVGICGCANGYDHSLEGKRVVLADRVCEIKEVMIDEAVGWGGFEKQCKALKASRCHFLLEAHCDKTELLLCQL